MKINFYSRNADKTTVQYWRKSVTIYSLVDLLPQYICAILTEIQKRRSSEEPSELVWKSSGSTPQPAEQEERQENDGIPSELKGATKWKTVKIKDPSTPSKASVFLGASEVCRNYSFVLFWEIHVILLWILFYNFFWQKEASSKLSVLLNVMHIFIQISACRNMLNQIYIVGKRIWPNNSSSKI